MTSTEFTEFLRRVFEHLVRYSIDGSIHFLFMDWRHVLELRHAADSVYTEHKNICIWNKVNAGLGSFYRSKHELIFVFKNGTAVHINNFGLGGDGRYRTNVWDYPGVNIRRPGGRTDLEMHPTAKPVALIMDAIKDCSRSKGVILDPFSGSGTTIIACERTRRIARAMELDPAYVDLAVRRWEALSASNIVIDRRRPRSLTVMRSFSTSSITVDILRAPLRRPLGLPDCPLRKRPAAGGLGPPQPAPKTPHGKVRAPPAERGSVSWASYL